MTINRVVPLRVRASCKPLSSASIGLSMQSSDVGSPLLLATSESSVAARYGPDGLTWVHISRSTSALSLLMTSNIPPASFSLPNAKTTTFGPMPSSDHTFRTADGVWAPSTTTAPFRKLSILPGNPRRACSASLRLSCSIAPSGSWLRILSSSKTALAMATFVSTRERLSESSRNREVAPALPKMSSMTFPSGDPRGTAVTSVAPGVAAIAHFSAAISTPRGPIISACSSG
mmetsp:Transcript_42104/g.103582  ORF Transcript_42104/g.103582 Transcript_42104/m.103582 type:complete len:231 (-) Transcript_42104:202-894(-)